jgi:hypothetical protein
MSLTGFFYSMAYGNEPKVAVGSHASKSVKVESGIKKAIWAYFLLLIFEGALRKWFLPFLSTPLLLVRDPIVIWALVKASKADLMPKNGFITTSITIGVISMLTAVAFGHGNILVAFFGARTFLFFLPFTFLVGHFFTQKDVEAIGRATLWIALPMTVLIALQFNSPQSAWVNRGVGGDEGGAGFSGALGFFRPPGTFSFTNGLSLFYSFTSCFVFYFWLNPQKINKLLLIAATFGLIAAIPLSISRGLFFAIGVVAIFVIIATARNPKYLGKMIAAGIGLFILLTVLSSQSFFQNATEALTHRFESASNSEGGVEGTLMDRYVGGTLESISATIGGPFFGYGSGISSNVGSRLLSGRVISGVAEDEPGRLITELGPLMGLIIIFVRLGMSLRSIVFSYRKLAVGNTLPWILLPYSLLLGPQANWAQPTALGFSVLAIGLVFAAFNVPKRVGAIKKRAIAMSPN